jgi:hypothetical protein
MVASISGAGASPLLSTGLQGVQAGLDRAQESADTIARSGVARPQASDPLTPGVTGIAPVTSDGETGSGTLASDGVEAVSGGLYEVTEASVNLKAAEQQVAASARVIQTADEVIGSLIDTSA